ncbi:MAG TPA: SDR family oxidoreductase [Myxococcaceae bacterium]|nr:SDR family oxidoreductase [Myxococcaceae bacterium]
MDLGLRDRRALVLGASAGLGRAVAAALVAEGARVAICARNRARVEAAARELGALVGLAVDLTVPGAATALVETATQRLGGGLDILVTNTGGPPKGHFPDITDAMWHEGFQALWLSAVDAIRAALPGMRERRWGRILLITSTAAKEPIPGLTVSNGMRAGVLGLVNSLAPEVAEDGVTVNALLPGYTATERISELGIPEDALAEHVPARRLGRPEELGAMAAFLASELAGYVTGQAIAVDGGFVRGL